MKLKRIIHGVLLVMGLSVLGLLFYYAMWLITDEEFREMFKHGWPWQSWEMLVDYAACCLFTTVVTLYYWGSREKAQRERDKFRMQALENQLSPHFVFNNFSILADLIEVDSKQASTYLMNLSKVYRYTLTHLDHETVTLQEELEFLGRYLDLLQLRFGESLQVRIADEVSRCDGLLPPAALQMLIENAIKHNKHTQTRPLIIDVTVENNHVSVSNRKQPIKTTECMNGWGGESRHARSNGRDEGNANVGQHNIVERYRLLTSQKVVIHDTQDEYRVIIPLIPTKR